MFFLLWLRLLQKIRVFIGQYSMHLNLLSRWEFFLGLFNIEQFKTACSTLEKCFNFLWLYNVHKCLLLLLVLYSILATASNLPNYDYYVCVTQSYALLLLNADILRQKLVAQLGTCFLPCFGLSWEEKACRAFVVDKVAGKFLCIFE